MSSATVNYKGVEFEVEYDFQPEEKATRDYPGCGMEITPTCITCEGVDFSEFFFEYGTIKEIEKVIQNFVDLIVEGMASAYDGRDY
jgi:hypothetical protein